MKKKKTKASIGDRYKLIASRITEGKILDIGAGSGDLKGFLPRNIEFHGVDIYPKGTGIKKVDVNEEKLPFKSGFFDYVVAAEVLEHLSNPGTCLKEIRRVLKKNGKLLVTVPNAYNFYHLIRAFFNRYSNTWEHVCIYDKRSIISLLRIYDFEVEEAFPMFFRMPRSEKNCKFLERRFPALCSYIFIAARSS